MHPSRFSIFLVSLTLCASARAQFDPHPAPGGHAPHVPVPELAMERSLLDLRMEPGQGSAGGSTWITTVAPTFVNIPRLSASFVAAQDGTNLAITFSGEAYTTSSEKRMFVRALIDGVVAAPTDVVFTEGSFSAARSFLFTGAVGRGVHTVEMQWLVDPGATAYLRAASIELLHARGDGDGGTVTHKTPPSGDLDFTRFQSWNPVPGASVGFYAPEGAIPIVTFSAETLVDPAGKRMFVRAKIDGVVQNPGDVVFAQRFSRQTHAMSFSGATLAKGWHTATIEWLVDAGGTAYVGDRSLVVSAFRSGNDLTHKLVVAPSGPSISTSSGVFAQIPDLSALVGVPKNGELSVAFSGEVSATTSAQLFVRLRANGVVIAEEEVVLAAAGEPFETQSFVFDRKHVSSTTGGPVITGVLLEWRAVGGTVWVGDRAMKIVVEPCAIPDLAEAPEIGRGSSDHPLGRPVEAAIGVRKVLTIIHDIDRAPPNDVTPTIAAVQNAMYGPHGVADYFTQVSGGRFTLQNAGVLSYAALKSENHYWNHASFDCGAAFQDGYAGGHAERWAEAIQLANAAVDYASYDTDQDGTLATSELAVLIVVPQQSIAGFTRELDPFCSGLPLTVDGVVVPEISEWFTSNPAGTWSTAAHELSHLVLNLGDMYVNGANHDVEPGTFSLMGDNIGNSSHFDAMNKLALGWVTPLYAYVDAEYALQDVKESGEVLILPRLSGGDGQEFFAVENRESASAGDPLYDELTSAKGLAVWHVVEDSTVNASPPACMTGVEWAAITGNARRGIRLLRPTVDYAFASSSAWTDDDYELVDTGLVCPGGGVPDENVRNVLRWADGTAGGWGLLKVSAWGPSMSFFLDAP